MKPAPFDRLRTAVRRAHDWRQSRSAEARFTELQTLLASMAKEGQDPIKSYRAELWIRDREGMNRLAVNEIDRIDAAGDYVLIQAGSERHLMSAAISSLEQELDPRTHLRVHRGTILNVNRIRSLRRRGRGAVSAILTTGAEVAVGPSYTDRVMAALNTRRWR
jgi:two-component system LytT family response regulator